VCQAPVKRIFTFFPKIIISTFIVVQHAHEEKKNTFFVSAATAITEECIGTHCTQCLPNFSDVLGRLAGAISAPCLVARTEKLWNGGRGKFIVQK
jgi:hypothetical protein